MEAHFSELREGGSGGSGGSKKSFRNNSTGDKMDVKLSKAQREAVEKIGRRRVSGVRVGRDVAFSTARVLSRRGLVMWLPYGGLMFTERGEKLWTHLHPNSKYAIRTGKTHNERG